MVKKITLTLLTIVIMSSLVFAQSASSLYNEGVKLLKNGKTDQAITKFKKASLEDKKHIKSRLGLANAYFKLQKFNEAIAPLKEILNIKSNNQEALNLIVQAYYNTERYDDVINYGKQYFNSAKEPSYTAYYMVGKSYANKKQYSNALENFKKATDINQNDYKSLYEMGKIYYMAKKYNQAINYLSKTTNIREYPNAYYYLGKTYYKRKQYSKAAGSFKKVTELKPGFEYGHYYLAKSYKNSGQHNKAISSAKKLLQMKRSAKHYYLLGGIYLEAKNYQQAYNYYNQGSSYSGKYGKACTKWANYVQQKYLN